MTALPSWIPQERVIALCEQAFGPLYGVLNMPVVFKFVALIEQEIRSPNYWERPEQWLTEEDDSELPEVEAQSQEEEE